MLQYIYFFYYYVDTPFHSISLIHTIIVIVWQILNTIKMWTLSCVKKYVAVECSECELNRLCIDKRWCTKYLNTDKNLYRSIIQHSAALFVSYIMDHDKNYKNYKMQFLNIVLIIIVHHFKITDLQSYIIYGRPTTLLFHLPFWSRALQDW